MRSRPSGNPTFWPRMAVVAVVVIVVYSEHMPPERKLLQASLAIIMGGILGNFVDRIVRGYVIDFIDFHIYDTFHWPTFNVADSAITIGIALLLIDTVKNPAVNPAVKEDRGDRERSRIMRIGKTEFRSQKSGARMRSLFHAGSRAALFLFVSVFCLMIAVDRFLLCRSGDGGGGIAAAICIRGNHEREFSADLSRSRN